MSDSEQGGVTMPPTQHHLVTYTPGPGWLVGVPLFEQPLQEHAAYQASLLERGVLLLSGPLLDRCGGISILSDVDGEQVRAVLEDDPAIRSGVFTASASPLLIAFSAVPSSAQAPRPEPARSP